MPLFLIHIHQSVDVIREVQHNVLKFKVSVNDKDGDHVIESLDQLFHDCLDDFATETPSFDFHQVL